MKIEYKCRPPQTYSLEHHIKVHSKNISSPKLCLYHSLVLSFPSTMGFNQIEKSATTVFFIVYAIVPLTIRMPFNNLISLLIVSRIIRT